MTESGGQTQTCSPAAISSSKTAQDFIESVDVKPVNKKEVRSLYKAREKIHPKRAYGAFRQLKWWIMAFTLGIYYITPWLRWDRGPHAPDQAVLVDLLNRKFYFFFIEIWPQEFFYVAGLLIMAGIGLFLVTSTVGRAWCGYTCPQTVWVDLYLVVERWLEGDRNARIKLDKAPYSFDKIRKRIIKHILWILIAVATGGAWIFYFADAPSLLKDLFSFNAAPVAYMTVGVLTATTYIFAGFMREQVCTYMCPWPRIQAAMLDEDSLVVTYNDWRGEPRSRHKAKAGEETGDCIDCNLCVAVCPQGIDIRDGQQLECITCALCIDACNGVMEKTGKPRGLISYSTLKDYNQAMKGNPSQTTWRSFIRPRTFIYTFLWSMIGVGMLYALVTRDRLDMSILHDRNPLFVQLSDGKVRNGYTLKILNMVPYPRRFELRVKNLPGAEMSRAGAVEIGRGQLYIDVAPDSVHREQIYVTVYPPDIKAEKMPFEFELSDLAGDERATYDTVFQSPPK